MRKLVFVLMLVSLSYGFTYEFTFEDGVDEQEANSFDGAQLFDGFTQTFFDNGKAKNGSFSARTDFDTTNGKGS